MLISLPTQRLRPFAASYYEGRSAYFYCWKLPNWEQLFCKVYV